jgi:peptidoglycan hydrolase-like protein with peptidoglycan-binding domain
MSLPANRERPERTSMKILSAIVCAAAVALAAGAQPVTAASCGARDQKSCEALGNCIWAFFRCWPDSIIEVPPPITKNVQKRLDLKPDGVFGKKTQDALRKFQEEKGLPGTGKLDRETLKQLERPR